MNRADVLMLNESMQGLGDAFFKNRVLQQQADERELDRQMKQQIAGDATDARRQYYQNATAARQDAADARNKIADVAQQQADQKAAQDMLQAGLHINLAGAWAPGGRESFNKAIAANKYLGPTGIQIGEPAQKAPPQVGQNSLAAGIKFRNDLAAQRDALADGDPRKEDLTKQINMMDTTFDPSAMESYTEEKLDPVTGKVTSRVTGKRPRGQIDGPGSITKGGFQAWQAQQGQLDPNVWGGQSGPVSLPPGMTPPAPGPFTPPQQ